MSQTRREFLRTTATATALATVGGAIALSPRDARSAEPVDGPRSPAARKKNVLLLVFDDMRPALGCYGHPLVKSPNIDRLAKTGMVFERTYCQQAVCAPSRASMLTGRRPDTTKIYDLETHIRTTMPDVVTLQQHFRNSGYFTEGIGKVNHPRLEDAPSYSVPHRNAEGGNWVTPENLKLQKEGGKVAGDTYDSEPSGPRTMRAKAFESADLPDDAFIDGKMTQMAIESLGRVAPRATAASASERQPFFLSLGFRKPHLPFSAPSKYWALYDRATIPLPYRKTPTNVPDVALVNWLELRTFSGIPDVGPCSDDMTRELIHAYYACMSFVDTQVGRILAELDRLDLRKDTIIVLWSDHGVKLGEHGMWSKHTNFEEDTHVPLIIADPDYAAGSRTRALAESVDLYPTLAELCGLPPVEGLEGTSLVPLMVDPTQRWKSAAFSQYPRPGNIMGYSMRTDRYRYNEWVDRATREVKARELYDMTNDPECRVNLAPNDDQAALIAQLHGQLTAGWQAARP